MALTDQPYLPFYVQDWLSNNKLKICSMSAHGLMINIMSIMHKEDNYGTILLRQKFKQSKNQVINFAHMIAKLTCFESGDIEPILTELLNEKVLHLDGDVLYCKRMVNAAALSMKRSKSGTKGGNKTSKNFAKAKTQANTENEIEYENDNNISSNKSTTTVSKKYEGDIPTLDEFLKYAKGLCTKAGVKYQEYEFSLESRYNTWRDQKWHDGNGNKIRNWKNKLSNTLPYMRPIKQQSNGVRFPDVWDPDWLKGKSTEVYRQYIDHLKKLGYESVKMPGRPESWRKPVKHG